MVASRAEKQGEIRIEYVALSAVKRWPKNPKGHDREGISRSINRFGFVDPFLFDERTGRLVAGHGRLDDLELRRASGEPAPGHVKSTRKDWLVPVIRGVSFKNDQEAEAYLLATNRLVENGGWDDKLLREMLEGVAKDGDLLAATGFDDAFIKSLQEPVPPDEFPRVGPDITVTHQCPKCGYKFS